MLRSALRLVTAFVLAAAGLLWIVDSNRWSGPVVLRLSETHGVHSNDWLSFVLWALSVMVVAPAGMVRPRRTAMA